MTHPAPSVKTDRRFLRWLLLGLLVLFGGAYVAGYLLTGDRVARGTEIAGVPVGGRTPEAAARALTAALVVDADRSVTLAAGGHRVSLSPAALGLSVDATASVEQVPVGRSWDPSDMWEFVAGGSSYDVVVSVDEAKLDAALASFATKVDRPGKDGAVRFTRSGSVAPTYPGVGRAVDLDAARSAVLAAYPMRTDERVVLAIRRTQPSVTAAEVSRAMKEFGNPAVSAPVVFRIAGERVVLTPKDYARALSMKPVDGTLTPQLDRERLLAAIEPALKHVALAPRNASVRIVKGAPQVIPGKPGVTFDPDSIAARFLEVVVADGKDRQLRVATEIAAPDHTAAEMRRLGIKEQVSEFTTYFPYAVYRNVNIGRAAELINGTVLEPGDTFSLNGIVGERTQANGFTKGFVISDGVFKQDLGGGVSQVATTTFNAAFFAGLKDVEHKPHSFYISRYPVGREATVAWPTVDLKFTNDTPYGILVQAWRDVSTPSTQGAMHVRMWSTKYWDIKAGQSQRYNFSTHSTRHLTGPECEPNDGYGGFDIDVYRYFYKHRSATLDHKETMHTHYTPSDTVICSG